MQLLTPDGERIVSDAAQRHGFSFDAVNVMLQAVAAGGGSQAQFSHPEFGGMGQWSMGGMIMVGDMFNNNLKYRVEGLCIDLSNALANSNLYAPPPQPSSMQSQSQGGGSYQNQSGSYQSQSSGGIPGQGSSLFVPGPGSANWWPTDLGNPSSTGAQNSLRYAVFPNARRLAIDNNGQVTMYDIGDHQIGGFSQQQSGDQSITFTSQFGTVRVADLPVINPVQEPIEAPAVQPDPPITNHFVSEPVADHVPAAPGTPTHVGPPVDMPNSIPTQSANPEQSRLPPSTNSDEIFATIERLAELRKKEILTDSEFETKKAELLARL